MDNVFWVVIAAAVAIALAGIVLYIGSDSLQGTIDDADDTQQDSICRFEAGQVESNQITCDDISSRCEGEIDACS